MGLPPWVGGSSRALRRYVIHSIHAIGSRELGGAERFFARLTQALDDAGHSTTRVVRRGSALVEELPGASTLTTGMRNGLDVTTWFALRRLIRDRRPEIIQSYLGRASRLTRVPRELGTFHVARLGGYYRPNAYRHADAWVGNTEGICGHLLQSGFAKKRVFHIGNFVEVAQLDSPERTAEVRRGADVPSDALLIFALGRFIERKGFQDLVSAFSQLPDRVDGRPVILVLAGDGPLRSALVAQAEQLHIADRVRWLGWVTEPAPWIQAATVLVCPSRHEPLGNVILEAWANHTPVISTATAGARELIREGETGLMCPPGDPAEMGAHLGEILRQSAEARATLALNGLATLEANHSKTAVVARYLDLYTRALPALGKA